MAYGYGGFRITPQTRKNIIVVSTGIAALAFFGVLDAWIGSKVFNLFTWKQILGAILVIVTFWIWQGR